MMRHWRALIEPVWKGLSTNGSKQECCYMYVCWSTESPHTTWLEPARWEIGYSWWDRMPALKAILLDKFLWHGPQLSSFAAESRMKMVMKYTRVLVLPTSPPLPSRHVQTQLMLMSNGWKQEWMVRFGYAESNSCVLGHKELEYITNWRLDGERKRDWWSGRDTTGCWVHVHHFTLQGTIGSQRCQLGQHSGWTWRNITYTIKCMTKRFGTNPTLPQLLAASGLVFCNFVSCFSVCLFQTVMLNMFSTLKVIKTDRTQL